jgi:hypothetical protein
MEPSFVEKWTMEDKFADIMRGFGFLVPFSCKASIEKGTELLKRVIQPSLILVNQKA